MVQGLVRPYCTGSCTVQRKLTAISETSAPAVRTPAPVQQVKRGPSAAAQAQALLEFLHRQHAGKKVCAADVKTIAYPQLVAAMNWNPRGWDGTDGVGHHLGVLTGGRTFGWFEVDGERKRQRAYQIPLAITVRKRA